MLELFAASVQLCVDRSGFIIFGKKRRQQGLCHDIILSSDNTFSAHIFAETEEEVVNLRSVISADADVRVYTKGNMSMSNGMTAQQVTLTAMNTLDDMARHLKANQAMNRIGMNMTTYHIDTFSV